MNENQTEIKRLRKEIENLNLKEEVGRLKKEILLIKINLIELNNCNWHNKCKNLIYCKWRKDGVCACK